MLKSIRYSHREFNEGMDGGKHFAKSNVADITVNYQEPWKKIHH